MENIDFGAFEDDRDLREMKKQALAHELHELVSQRPPQSAIERSVLTRFIGAKDARQTNRPMDW